MVAALVLASSLASRFEGDRHKTYADVGGVPTICYGHTGKDVHFGEVRDQAGCLELLRSDMKSHAAGILPCIHVAIREHALAAMVDFAYNAGTGAFCRSSMARDINEGRLRAACEDLTKYVYAAGRVYPGLVRRRAAERAYCIQDAGW